MSTPNMLNPVLAALPANPAKSANPDQQDLSATDGQPFAAVLQQKMDNPSESRPAIPAAAQTATPKTAAETAAAETGLPLVVTQAIPAEILQAVLAALPTRSDASASLAREPEAWSEALPAETLNLLAAQAPALFQAL